MQSKARGVCSKGCSIKVSDTRMSPSWLSRSTGPLHLACKQENMWISIIWSKIPRHGFWTTRAHGGMATMSAVLMVKQFSSITVCTRRPGRIWRHRARFILQPVFKQSRFTGNQEKILAVKTIGEFFSQTIRIDSSNTESKRKKKTEGSDYEVWYTHVCIPRFGICVFFCFGYVCNDKKKLRIK